MDTKSVHGKSAVINFHEMSTLSVNNFVRDVNPLVRL